MRKPGATYVYFDIHTFGTCPNCEGGRMVFELFTETVPKTAENFRCAAALFRHIYTRAFKVLWIWDS